MKRSSTQRIAIALAVATLSALTAGCGSSNNNATVPIAGTPGSVLGGVSAGCVPISSQIPFSAQGIYFSWANIVGGLIPGVGQSIGQVVVGAGAVAGGQFSRQAVDGTISMNIVPAGAQYAGTYPTGYPGSIYPGTVPTQYQYPPTNMTGYTYGGYNQAPGTAAAQGYIMINPATQQDIYYQTGSVLGITGYGTYPGTYPTGTYPYPTGTPTLTSGYGQICVSGLAFNLGNYDGVLYGGQVYLYLNNTQHGYYFPI